MSAQPEPPPTRPPVTISEAAHGEGGGPRFPIAWFLLGAVFTVFIGVALSGYFAPSERGEDADPAPVLAAEEAQIRLAGALYVVSKQGPTTSPSARGQYDEALAALERRVSGDRSLDGERWRLTVQILQGKPPDAAGLARLREEGDAAMKAFADSIDPRTPLEEASRSRASLGSDLPARVAKALPRDEGFEARVFPLAEAIPKLAVLSVAAGAGLLGFVALLVFGILAARGKLRPVGYPKGGMSLADADRFALRMAAYLALFAIIPGVTVAALEPFVEGSWALVVGMCLFVTALFLALRVPILGVPDPVSKLVGDTGNLVRHVGIGVVAFLANLPIVLVLAVGFQALLRGLPTPSHPVTDQIASDGVGGLVPLLILAAVFAPVVEELTFRGLLFPALGRRMPLALAGLVSGLLFAAIHPQGPILWAGLAAIGCMAAYVTHLTGSLVPAIVMHAVHNAFIVTLATVVFL